ncbi:GntR family transcriptional regulator, partial [Enterococcus faecium]
MLYYVHRNDFGGIKMKSSLQSQAYQ